MFLRHDTSQWLPGYNPGAWFYILGGMEEVLFCTILLFFLRSPLPTAALWIGISEGMQVSTCRLLTADMSKVPKGANLCDALTGWHVGAIMTGVYLFIVCMAIGKEWRRRDG
jgi:hypothetical protein